MEPEQGQTVSAEGRRHMVSAWADHVSGGGVEDLSVSPPVPGLQVDDDDPLLPQIPHKHVPHVFILFARKHLYSNIGQTFPGFMHHLRHRSTRF